MTLVDKCYLLPHQEIALLNETDPEQTDEDPTSVDAIKRRYMREAKLRKLVRRRKRMTFAGCKGRLTGRRIHPISCIVGHRRRQSAAPIPTNPSRPRRCPTPNSTPWCRLPLNRTFRTTSTWRTGTPYLFDGQGKSYSDKTFSGCRSMPAAPQQLDGTDR